MGIQSKQEILNEMKSVWSAVTSIETTAKKVLGEKNSITESLGFAWVHMMNACIEIEDHINQ